MKNVFFILMGVVAISSTARAQSPDCVESMMKAFHQNEARAEYGCSNPNLFKREGDTREQNIMRLDMIREAEERKEHMADKYLVPPYNKDGPDSPSALRIPEESDQNLKKAGFDAPASND